MNQIYYLFIFLFVLSNCNKSSTIKSKMIKSNYSLDFDKEIRSFAFGSYYNNEYYALQDKKGVMVLTNVHNIKAEHIYDKLIYSPNGEIIIAISNSCNECGVSFLDARTGKLLHKEQLISDTDYTIRNIALCPSKGLVAYLKDSEVGLIKVSKWLNNQLRIERGNIIKKFPTFKGIKGTCLNFNNDGSILAIGDNKGTIYRHFEYSYETSDAFTVHSQ